MIDRTTTAGFRATLALLVAVAALAVAIFGIAQRGAVKPASPTSPTPVRRLLEHLEATNELHAGYGVYPPYTQEDPNTKKVSGLSVDLIEDIGRDLKVKVVWHRFNWNTMSADLKRGDFDLIADPIFLTIPRGREFTFTIPYAQFADGIAVVRAQERRFPTFQSLDTPGVRVAVGQGWASETFIRSRFTKASVQAVQTATDLLQVFNEVLSGRADVAVADGADAQRFAKEHPNEVKVLFLDAPPAFMPASFALRPGDSSGAEFLNVALRNLEATGVLDALARKYNVITRTESVGR